MKNKRKTGYAFERAKQNVKNRFRQQDALRRAGDLAHHIQQIIERCPRARTHGFRNPPMRNQGLAAGYMPTILERLTGARTDAQSFEGSKRGQRKRLLRAEHRARVIAMAGEIPAIEFSQKRQRSRGAIEKFGRELVAATIQARSPEEHALMGTAQAA